MRAMNFYSLTRREFLTAAGTASLLSLPFAMGCTTKSAAGSNSDNLMAGYNRECFASGAYQLFAKKADEEGYGPVASLFRALVQAEKVHAELFTSEIRRLNAEPIASSQAPEPKSTRENLGTAIAVEKTVSGKEFPAYQKEANEEGAQSSARVFGLCVGASAIHEKLCRNAARNLGSLKNDRSEVFYVCPTCGHIVKESDHNFNRCPLCGTPNEFVKVT